MSVAISSPRLQPLTVESDQFTLSRAVRTALSITSFALVLVAFTGKMNSRSAGWALLGCNGGQIIVTVLDPNAKAVEKRTAYIGHTIVMGLGLLAGFGTISGRVLGWIFLSPVILTCSCCCLAGLVGIAAVASGRTLEELEELLEEI